MSAVGSLFNWKVRGFRVVEIIGVLMLAAIVVSVYYAKTEAARQGAEIDRLQRAIVVQRDRVRALNAEAARLEDPARLEALSRDVGLQPAGAQGRLSLDELPLVVSSQASAPAIEGGAP